MHTSPPQREPSPSFSRRSRPRSRDTADLRLRRPDWGDRNLQRFRRHHRLLTGVMIGSVLAVCTVAGIDRHDPLFGLSLAIVCLPPAIIVIVGMLADIGHLSPDVRKQVGLLLRKTVATAALGLLMTFVQAFAGTTIFNSVGALDIAIATVAGVSTWPHAIEAHYLVKRHLRRRRRRFAKRAGGIRIPKQLTTAGVGVRRRQSTRIR